MIPKAKKDRPKSTVKLTDGKLTEEDLVDEVKLLDAENGTMQERIVQINLFLQRITHLRLNDIAPRLWTAVVDLAACSEGVETALKVMHAILRQTSSDENILALERGFLKFLQGMDSSDSMGIAVRVRALRSLCEHGKLGAAISSEMVETLVGVSRQPKSVEHRHHIFDLIAFYVSISPMALSPELLHSVTKAVADHVSQAVQHSNQPQNISGIQSGLKLLQQMLISNVVQPVLLLDLISTLCLAVRMNVVPPSRASPYVTEHLPTVSADKGTNLEHSSHPAPSKEPELILPTLDSCGATEQSMGGGDVSSTAPKPSTPTHAIPGAPAKATSHGPAWGSTENLVHSCSRTSLGEDGTVVGSEEPSPATGPTVSRIPSLMVPTGRRDNPPPPQQQSEDSAVNTTPAVSPRLVTTPLAFASAVVTPVKDAFRSVEEGAVPASTGDSSEVAGPRPQREGSPVVVVSAGSGLEFPTGSSLPPSPSRPGTAPPRRPLPGQDSFPASTSATFPSAASPSPVGSGAAPRAPSSVHSPQPPQQQQLPQ
eukprot:RCo041045